MLHYYSTHSHFSFLSLLYVFVSSFLSLIAICLSLLSSLRVTRFEQQQAWPPSPAAATDASTAAAARQRPSSSLYFLDDSTREVSACSSTSTSARWWSRTATTRILRRNIDGTTAAMTSLTPAGTMAPRRGDSDDDMTSLGRPDPEARPLPTMTCFRRWRCGFGTTSASTTSSCRLSHHHKLHVSLLHDPV
jgi:hypothetical protein